MNPLAASNVLETPRVRHRRLERNALNLIVDVGLRTAPRSMRSQSRHLPAAYGSLKDTTNLLREGGIQEDPVDQAPTPGIRLDRQPIPKLGLAVVGPALERRRVLLARRAEETRTRSLDESELDDRQATSWEPCPTVPALVNTAGGRGASESGPAECGESGHLLHRIRRVRSPASSVCSDLPRLR